MKVVRNILDETLNLPFFDFQTSVEFVNCDLNKTLNPDFEKYKKIYKICHSDAELKSNGNKLGKNHFLNQNKNHSNNCDTKTYFHSKEY